ncbi:MAG: lantibiotic dehydratase family protein [Bacteroidetes bacterium]|nr:lantibiotic dehydratase family protein [Bacteroidota bacterium]
MSSKKIPYKNFSKYVLRTPLFSVDFFKSITKNKTTTDEELKSICKDKRIIEAIFLASPDLSNEVNKWLNDELNDEKSERIKYSVFKYLSRMSSRCTPFGLFAGTAVGEFSNSTHIELDKNFKNNRHTRLDMNYLVALTQTIVEIKAVRDQLKFYPNTSLYKVGGQFRYVEYSYINTKRTHHIVGVNYTWYLDKIIKASKEGRTIKQLAQIITNKGILFEEAFTFVTELIESQILISELEPSVSGPEFLEHILAVLKKLNYTDDIISILEKVESSLHKIDKSITNDISEYLKIGELLKPLNTKYELKYLFQTDMILSCKKNTLDYSVLNKIKSVLSLLNKISFKQEDSPFSQFKTAFYERYETKPVTLSKALDKELGIGFLQNNDYGEVSTLVDDLNLPFKTNKPKEFKVITNVVQDILQNKLIECIKSNKDVLIINENDFADLDLVED